MASSNKNSSKRQKNSDGELGDEDMQNSTVQVDFEAITPDDRDFDGIKRLLTQLFLKSHIDLSELTNLLLQQNYVCSILKQSQDPQDSTEDEDEDECFGFMSVVNLTDKKDVKCIQQIRQLLLEKCQENGNKDYEKFKSALDGNCGLIFNERFINIPPQVALPMYDSLMKDMAMAREKKLKFDFSTFVIISKIFKADKSKQPNDESIIYANAEEELIAEEADFWFDYNVGQGADTALGGSWKEDDSEFSQNRRILVLASSKWPVLSDKLKKELSIKT